MLKRALAALVVVVAATSAMAGPPIVCNPIEIGKARTLPMGTGATECSSGYTAAKAADETVAILKTESSPLVHMETLRRATVYVAKDEAQARQLFSRVLGLGLDAEAAKDEGRVALALFDAGFLAACFGEMGVDLGWKPGLAEGALGYGWIRAALERASGEERAEMEYGAALAAHPMDHTSAGVRAIYDAHLKRATEGAKEGSLLAANIKAHHAKWDPYLDKDGGAKK
jgi:hypothetical protein